MRAKEPKEEADSRWAGGEVHSSSRVVARPNVAVAPLVQVARLARLAGSTGRSQSRGGPPDGRGRLKGGTGGAVPAVA